MLCGFFWLPWDLLYGVIPDALLDTYHFWQDESIVPLGTTIDQFESAMRDTNDFVAIQRRKTENSWFLWNSPLSARMTTLLIQNKKNNGFDTVISFSFDLMNYRFKIQATGLPGRTGLSPVVPKNWSKRSFDSDNKSPRLVSWWWWGNALQSCSESYLVFKFWEILFVHSNFSRNVELFMMISNPRILSPFTLATAWQDGN